MTSPQGSPPSSEASAPEVSQVSHDYVSPSMEVLEQLEMQSAISHLEARLDSLEIDIARQSGSRDDDARRIAGEMAVMKARVEDALTAFSGTSDELRELCRNVERRLEDVVSERLGEAHPEAGALRAELRAGIDGVMAGVGDVLESLSADVRARIETLGTQMLAVQDGMLRIAEAVGTLTPLADRLLALEKRVNAR